MGVMINIFKGCMCQFYAGLTRNKRTKDKSDDFRCVFAHLSSGRTISIYFYYFWVGPSVPKSAGRRLTAFLHNERYTTHVSDYPSNHLVGSDSYSVDSGDREMKTTLPNEINVR